MVIKTIYVTRHAFRGNYTVNTSTGEYHTNSPSPTNIPNDPPLAAYGVQQSRDLAIALAELDPSIDIIYSSPFYRCLQTIEPAVEKLGENIEVKVDNGIGYVRLDTTETWPYFSSSVFRLGDPKQILAGFLQRNPNP